MRHVATGLVLGTALLLGGCGAFDRATGNAADGVSNLGGRIGMPWGSNRPVLAEDSATIRRVAGQDVALAALQPEPGDVWPQQEAPRATLANPDAALRGIPNYQPGELDRPSRPAPRSQWQPTDPPAPSALPPGLQGSSSPPPPPLRQPEIPPPQARAPALPAQRQPRGDAGVIQTPTGPAFPNGGTDRVQTYVTPGGGGGVVTRDGGVTTLIGPNGQVQTVPTPR